MYLRLKICVASDNYLYKYTSQIFKAYISNRVFSTQKLFKLVCADRELKKDIIDRGEDF